MLSYRHGYHAGNFADLLKHSVLCTVIDYLQKKPSPLLILDTHAGGGLYDLSHAYAQKTGEYAHGVGRLAGFVEKQATLEEVPTLFQPLLRQVQKVQRGKGLTRYPGSPFLIKQALRPQDRAVFYELHSTEAKNLRTANQDHGQIEIFHDDGLKGVRRMVPPRGPYEGMRSLTLIDPSYEIKSDYDDVPDAVARAWKKSPQAVSLIWYPVIDRARTENMMKRYQRAGIKRILRIEQGLKQDGAVRGMTAAGVLVINPPFTLLDQAKQAMPWLHEKLNAEGRLKIYNLTGE